MALPLGELSPQVTERVLHPWFPSPSPLRSATSPKGRGKGRSHYNTGTIIQEQAQRYSAVPVDCLTPPAAWYSGCSSFFRATPRNSARSLSQNFCPNSKFRKWRNTVCISHFWNCGSGAKRRLRLADAIVRCCLRYALLQLRTRLPWFRRAAPAFPRRRRETPACRWPCRCCPGQAPAARRFP